MATYGYTFTSGDTLTPTKLNNARTVSEIVNADIASAAAIDKTKISGTAITAADTGTVTSTMIADGTIVNADINASAAIAGTKISPNFGSQNVATTGTVSSKNLAVYGATNNDFAVRVTNTGTTNAYGFIVDGVNSPFALAVRDAANQYRFVFGGDGTASMGGALGNALNIDASGNVGIGTSSPGEKLHVAGICRLGPAGGEGGELQILNVAGNAVGSQLDVGPSDELRLINAQNTFTSFHTNNTERLRIDASGNVGIGTSSPDYKLSLQGADHGISFQESGATYRLVMRGNSLLPEVYDIKEHGANRVAISFDCGNQVLNLLTAGTQRLRVKSTGQVRFQPLASDPSGAESGDVYYNSTSNKLKVYNGTAWVDLH